MSRNLPRLSNSEKAELERLYEHAMRPDLGPGEGYHGLVVAFLQRHGVRVGSWREARPVCEELLWGVSSDDERYLNDTGRKQ
jgi:hypothetical protein